MHQKNTHKDKCFADYLQCVPQLFCNSQVKYKQIGKAALHLKTNSTTASMSFYEGHAWYLMCPFDLPASEDTEAATYILEPKHNWKILSFYPKKAEDTGPMCKNK